MPVVVGGRSFRIWAFVAVLGLGVGLMGDVFGRSSADLADAADLLYVRLDIGRWIEGSDDVGAVGEESVRLATDLELTVDYDGDTGVVRWAEFGNVTPAVGSIRLEFGVTQFDSNRLDAQTWASDRTVVHDDLSE